MKTSKLRKFLPIAVVALGLGGAFTTTSMQRASEVDPRDGFTRDPNTQKCTDIKVDCTDIPSGQMCRVSYLPAGPIAYDKVGSNDCLQPLYKPN